jgi:hypothetical protein
MRKWLLTGAAVLVVALGSGIAWAQWSGSRDDCAPDDGTNAAGPVATSTGSAADYWTPERMREASGAPQPGDGNC